MRRFPFNAAALCSRTPEESQVEGCEHQDDADIRDEAFPEAVSEEREVRTDDDGDHSYHVKNDRKFAHFNLLRVRLDRSGGKSRVEHYNYRFIWRGSVYKRGAALVV
jgi:hypothetical protein